MIDLKKELNILLKSHYDYILVRRKTNNKCHCWRRESNTPNPNCKSCGGSGWLFIEFINKCKIFMIDSLVVSHLQSFDYGKSYNNSLTIYMPINSNTITIKKDDILFRIEQDTSGKVYNPLKRLDKWLVTDNIPFRCDNGKLEFLKVLAKPDNI